MDKVKIIVATHKSYAMPTDKMYLPLHVGAEGKFDKQGKPLDFGFQKDNTGDNISAKNACFGTQTALYWAWKNVDAGYIGLVHYRRHFLGKKIKKGDRLQDCVITEKQLTPMLGKYKVFVPKKRHYYIETIYSHYSHTMTGGADQLDTVRKIIQEISPEYLNAFDRFMKQRSGYVFNMMIVEQTLFKDYCAWLFPVLFELEKRLDTSVYNDFDNRYAGRVSERLFNVWILRKLETGELKKNEIQELPYNEEVNWFKKVSSFIGAKIFKKKYGASF